MEAHDSLQLCEHAVHGRTAVHTTPTHLAQGQNWTLISETLIGKELVRVLEKQIKYEVSFISEEDHFFCGTK